MILFEPAAGEFVLKQLRSDPVLLAIVQMPVIRCPGLSALKNPIQASATGVVVKAAGRLPSNEPIKGIHDLQNSA